MYKNNLEFPRKTIAKVVDLVFQLRLAIEAIEMTRYCDADIPKKFCEEGKVNRKYYFNRCYLILDEIENLLTFEVHHGAN